MKTMRIMRSKYALSLGLELLRMRNNTTNAIKNAPAKITLMLEKYR